MKKHVLRPLMTVLAAAALTINVWALPKTLIPGGCTVGVKLYSQGLVVTGFETKSAAKEAGLKKGDGSDRRRRGRWEAGHPEGSR